MKTIQTFLHLVKREFSLFLRNSTLRSVFILAPVVYALLFAFVYRQGKVTHLPVIVVDKDNSPMSNQLIEMLQDNEGLAIKKVAYESTDLKKEVIRQDAAALVMIPERFEADMLQKRYPEIVTYINTSNLLTANFSSKAIQTTLGTFSAGAGIKALQRKGMSASQAATQYEPFKANYIRLYNETGNYLTFMWPAMLAVILQQVILLAMAVSFAQEFQKSTFATEFLSYTRSAFGAVLVKVMPVWILSVAHILLFYVFHRIFQAPMPHHLFNFVVISSLFVMSVSFLGTLLSILIPDALRATQILMVISTPGFIIGGFTWPSASMPLAIQYLADILPLTPFLQAFKILLIQGGELSDTLPYLRHLALLALIFGSLSVLALKLKVRKELKKLPVAQSEEEQPAGETAE